MDLFTYNPTYRVWICTPCGYAVCPPHLKTHLAKKHQGHPSAATSPLRQIILDQMIQRPWLNPSKEPCPVPTPSSPPIEGLTLFRGLGCPNCPYVARSVRSMAKHHQKTHRAPGNTRAGRRPRGYHPRYPWRPLHCQRFFPTAAGSSFFAVEPRTSPDRNGPRRVRLVSEPEFARAQVLRDLQYQQAVAEAAGGLIPAPQSATEVCPWLDLTQWARYVQGHELASIREKKVNEFDLMRINSILHRPRVWDRPLFIDVQDATWWRYSQIWKRLICFAYRSTRSDAPVRLSHRLTRSQRVWLDQMVHHARSTSREQPRQS
ncbi:hypothetical protein BDV12DRAFT_209310 [Aspergillus spectabilis]